MTIKTPILLTTATVGLLLSASGAFAQQQSMNQQKCLNMLNKDGSLVAKEQGKANSACLKGAGMGTLPSTAQSCLTADANGKVQTKQNKTVSNATKFCGTPPSFGFTSAATVNGAAVQAEVDLVADIFGANLDTAVVSCSTSKAGCQCQQKVLGDVEKLADKKLAEFIKCKKTALKNGATSATSLRNCVNNAGTPGSIAADTKGMLQKALKTVNTGIDKKCDMPGVTSGKFPGDCSSFSGSALGGCLDILVECRVCQMLNEMDGLFVNCDLFDDGVANGSCASGTGPTPSPSPSPSPGPGVVLKGSLTQTLGKFNYNMMIGLPAANAACPAHFGGTHPCTYQELQSAGAAGDLDGLKDFNNVTVTSFWAIDPMQPPLSQCQDDNMGGSFLNWEYGTGHTLSKGQRVGLTNATGVLGSLQSGVSCGATSWVGCCQ